MLVAWYCSICCKKVTFSGVYAPKSDAEMDEFEICLRASGLSESVIEYVRMKRRTLSKVRVCTWHVPTYSKLAEPQCKARSQNILPEFVENPNSPTQIAETFRKLADKICKDENELSNIPSLTGLPKDESPSECSNLIFGDDQNLYEGTKNVGVPLFSKKRKAVKRSLDEESLEIEDLVENRRQRLKNSSSSQSHRVPILTSQSKRVSSQTPSTSGLESSNWCSLEDLLDFHSSITQINSQIVQVPEVEVQQQSETLSLIKGSYFLISGEMLLEFLQNCRCEENLSERLVDVPKGNFPFVHSTCPCGGMQVYRGLPKL
ncbi:unnamed protein product, partial [Mesorhabditis belari]|uniref:Uncharacterized protein n=1 Tax=Mesorhabditis belari TaxID=2138241 RepID=A0AAF3FPK7_9BILA